MAPVPLPRRPLGSDTASGAAAGMRHWYENALGWPTVPGEPLLLRTGIGFDVLEVPAEAGAAALRHLAAGTPVALDGDRMRLWVAAGSAEELPGLLEWLEWGALAPGLGLTAFGAGGAVAAPRPPGGSGTSGRGQGPESGIAGRSPGGSAPSTGPSPVQGVAVWLRPPEPGCEVEASLPTLSALGGGGGTPDLTRVVDTVATWCHRIRLRRAGAARAENQPLAFS